MRLPVSSVLLVLFFTTNAWAGPIAGFRWPRDFSAGATPTMNAETAATIEGIATIVPIPSNSQETSTSQSSVTTDPAAPDQSSSLGNPNQGSSVLSLDFAIDSSSSTTPPTSNSFVTTTQSSTNTINGTPLPLADTSTDTSRPLPSTPAFTGSETNGPQGAQGQGAASSGPCPLAAETANSPDQAASFVLSSGAISTATTAPGSESSGPEFTSLASASTAALDTGSSGTILAASTQDLELFPSSSQIASSSTPTGFTDPAITPSTTGHSTAEAGTNQTATVVPSETAAIFNPSSSSAPPGAPQALGAGSPSETASSTTGLPVITFLTLTATADPQQSFALSAADLSETTATVLSATTSSTSAAAPDPSTLLPGTVNVPQETTTVPLLETLSASTPSPNLPQSLGTSSLNNQDTTIAVPPPSPSSATTALRDPSPNLFTPVVGSQEEATTVPPPPPPPSATSSTSTPTLDPPQQLATIANGPEETTTATVTRTTSTQVVFVTMTRTLSVPSPTGEEPEIPVRTSLAPPPPPPQDTVTIDPDTEVPPITPILVPNGQGNTVNVVTVEKTTTITETTTTTVTTTVFA